MNIGEEIKKIRKEAGLSQKELGERLKVSQAMIAQYENGKRIPKVGTIQKIADALGVPEYELRGLDGSIRINPNPEREKLDDEAQKILIKIATDEKITKEESQKVSDYIKRKQGDYDNLSKSIKNFVNIISEYLKHNTQMPDEIVQNLKENLQKLTDLTPTMPDFYENLNDIGRKKAAEQIDMLTKIPEYQKKPPEPPEE